VNVVHSEAVCKARGAIRRRVVFASPLRMVPDHPAGRGRQTCSGSHCRCHGSRSAEKG
jgi:hypothetical protein